MAFLIDKTSKSVTKSITKILSPFKEKIRTIIINNGSESNNHEIISQRAIYEDTNRLFRQYIPKITDFRIINKKDIARIERALNNRPRKKLGFKTPKEVFLGTLPMK